MAEIETAQIDTDYSRFYADRTHTNVYPTEFVVRILLGTYPELKFNKPISGDRILDVGFGDGRNTVFLCDLGLDVYGIEITEDIVEQSRTRLATMGYLPDLKVGRNSSIPYADDYFDCILASHCCYYCDECDTLEDNLREYSRVLKSGGTLIASVADSASYIFKNAQRLPDGTLRVTEDPYGNRVGYRLHAFDSRRDIEEYLSPMFESCCFGTARNDYFGIDERVYWVVAVCSKEE